MFQTLIANGGVFVNKKKTKKHYRVRAGDVITFTVPEQEKPSMEPDATVPFSVVADDPEFAVIDKPAGVVVHPSHTHKKGTLVNGLLAKWPSIKGVGEDPLRPGIVHRLDKDTSGLMVIAKTQPMFLWLKKQFQERKVKKRYNALVHGKPKKDEFEVAVSIGRLGTKQVAVKNENRGFSGKVNKSRFARTGFKFLASYDGYSLLDAIPEAGRMHQIRVHLKYAGYPLVGDQKYSSRKQYKQLPLKRHFLHAAYLAFTLPDGRNAAFSSPLPPDLEAVLRDLKGKPSSGIIRR